MSTEKKEGKRSRAYRVANLTKEDKALESLFKRQQDDISDTFTSIYTKCGLLEPRYNFNTLYTIYEQSDVLLECISAYQQNIDGFGYQLQYTGQDQTKKTEKDLSNFTKLKNFFDMANEAESWITIRKNMRQDLEVLGNGGFEVIRNLMGEIQLVYHIPFKTMRASILDPTPIIVPCTIMRDGKLIKLRLTKYFRKYAQLEAGGKEVVWFKSFGDPRVMDKNTGEFLPAGTLPIPNRASEILHFRLNFGGEVYGIPRWMGAILDILGRRNGQYINWDLMRSQGIPPMLIMVSGGTLTDESLEELEIIVRGMRGVTQWNKIAVLESSPQSTGLEDRGSAKIELKNLTEFRKDDLMFAKYLESSERNSRHTFRLPRMYVGASEAFTHATSVVARISAEEQVFMPERHNFDEVINLAIIQKEFGITEWIYATKGPKIVGSKELALGVDAFSKIGAFTINHVIAMANEAFGLQMSSFSEKWADYPIPIVLKLAELGRLGEIDTIVSDKSLNETGPDMQPAPIGEAQKDIGEQNIRKMEQLDYVLDSDIFSFEEKELYKRLLIIQKAIVTPINVEVATDG